LLYYIKFKTTSINATTQGGFPAACSLPVSCSVLLQPWFPFRTCGTVIAPIHPDWLSHGYLILLSL